MRFCPACLVLLAVLLSGGGCRKPEASGRSLAPTVLPPDTIASVHWVGKRRLDLEFEAYLFCRVWSLPETTRLQGQTLDKLSTGVWRTLLGDTVGERIPPAVLRPVLEELSLVESYLEIRAVTNASPSFILATRVSPSNIGGWTTNLAIVAALLGGASPKPDPTTHGWTLQRTNPPALVALSRVGDWMVLSVGPAPDALGGDIVSRIRRDGVPFVSAGTNLWFEASLALSRLAAAFPAPLWEEGGRRTGDAGIFSIFNFQPSTVDHVSLSLSGDGANVITRARVNLASPLSSALESWQLPLPLLHEPLTSFTAVRGLQPLLAGSSWMRQFPGGTPPDQLFLWSLSGSPYQVYLAASLPAARQMVAALSDNLVQNGNPWLAANGYIGFDRAPDGNGVTWGSLPDIRPFIKFSGGETQGWLYAGLLPEDPPKIPLLPDGMIQDILRRTNLVYYDWEVTGPRLQPCLQLGQTARLVARRAQLPADCPSLIWLAALKPWLGTSATIVNRPEPSELTFYRRSTIGLTASELQLLVDWLESPRFPRGLHSSAP